MFAWKMKPFSSHKIKWPRYLERVEVQLQNILEMFLKKGNWMGMQHVGNSDKFVWKEEEKLGEISIITILMSSYLLVTV